MKKPVQTKRLVVFLSNFPYGFSEPYFGTELPYLAKHFDQISLVPADLAPSISTEKLSFDLPENARVEEWKVKQFSKFNGLEIFKMLLSPIFRQELWNLVFKFKPNSRSLALKTCVSSWLRAMSFAEHLAQTNLVSGLNENVVLYSYWCTDLSLAMAMLKEQGFTQTMITRIHAWDLYFDRDPSGYLPFRSFIFSKLDGVYPISEKGRNYLLETLGSEFGPQLRVARLGTEPLQSKPYVREAKILRILSISKIIPLKRLDLLIESLGIAQRSISIVWHHLGGDDAQTKALAESKLKGVDFTFFAFQGKVRYYQQLEENTYDLFINLSTKEGLPVSMMECMSLGIPVLATDVGAVSEIVDHEKNGWLISVDSDAKSIAEKICSIALLTEEEMQQTRQAAYLKWDSNFNSIRNYSDFSEKLLKF